MEHLKSILFIDIETVPVFHSFSGLSDALKKEWIRKAGTLKHVAPENADPADLFTEKAGVFSEFAKVIVIGIGSLYQLNGAWKMRLKALMGDDETGLLIEFSQVLERFAKQHSDFRFCGHNIKEFDIPFLCRRMVINGLPLPFSMQLYGKKPWEVTHLDTLELWKYGDYKNFTSLSLLATVLGIPSPKSDIDGSMVAGVYWEENDLARIGKYCLQDVLTSAKVYLKVAGIYDIDIEPAYV